ncbi:MAG: SCP2 sterol-binding domain-containing protein [Pseudomonadota bacterium]
MSDIIEGAVKALSEKLDGNVFDGSAKFVIEGLGAIRIEGGSVEISDAEADVTMSADADTFKGILTGDINPTSAFMSGQLSIDGDMGKAMALGQVLS